jgi:predicted transcriptional regulator
MLPYFAGEAMRKTSVYLDDVHAARLKRIAEAEGRSQAEVIRDAIMKYPERDRPRRKFAMAGIARGPGGSVADMDEEELLKGFGE